VVTEPVDPVHERRARIAAITKVAKRAGYAALLVAIIAFIAGIAADFPGWLVTLTLAALVFAIIVLPVPIVLGYGIRAAEREERQARRH
jgi:hypothetical protein